MSRSGVIAALAVCAALLAACGDDNEQPGADGTGGGRAHLHGVITYRQRIALPPEATATVALIAMAGPRTGPTVIAANNMRDIGQVPIEFMLTFPANTIAERDSYALRARILDAQGNVRWATRRPLVVDPLSDGGKIEVPVIAAGPPGGRRVHYACDGFVADVTAGKDAAVIEWGGQQAKLPNVAAASGAKYAAENVMFWGKSQVEALIKAGGTTHRGCAATTRLTQIGPHLRANGDGPEWMLRLRGEQGAQGAQLVIGKGKQAQVWSFADVKVAEPANKQHGQRVYGASDGTVSLAAMVAENTCSVGKNGDTLPLTVTVQIKDQIYQGCGEQID